MYPLKNLPKLYRTYTHGVRTYYNAKHRGVDFIVDEGTPIYAPFDGVARAKESDTIGRAVYFTFAVDGKKYVMRCLHLSDWNALGEVKQGTIIGYSGNTGQSTAPHVHLDLCPSPFLLYPFSRFIDPLKFDWIRDRMSDMEYEKIIRKLNTEIGRVTKERDIWEQDFKREIRSHEDTQEHLRGERKKRMAAEQKLRDTKKKLERCMKNKLASMTLIEKIQTLFKSYER